MTYYIKNIYKVKKWKYNILSCKRVINKILIFNKGQTGHIVDNAELIDNCYYN